MRILMQDRGLMYHHLEWVLMHPRFGFLMLGLILLSFTHDRMLATMLFVVFAVEIGFRIAIMLYKVKTNPYRTSLNRKMDGLFLVLDIVGVASLLITMLEIPIQAENVAAIRLLRAVYLLRTLRMFRYLDLQSAMYSPTYGMFISLVVMVSFFATDTLMWVIIIFFSVELAIRFFIMRAMNFESPRDRWMEWGFWWLDLVATVVMIPAFAVIPYGGVLRMMRLIRMLRPWLVILRNLREVIREGQYMQEINLIVLILAVISIAGGVVSGMLLNDFDFTQNGVVDASDNKMLAHIWFSFRLFTDPGNAVFYPETSVLAVYSIIAVVMGVFIFAFFIGIGSSIVSGLMEKLRNERLVITNHMVMLGWNRVSPYVISALRMASERNFSKLKLVLLHHEKRVPEVLLEEKWVTYRYGDPKQIEDLGRVNTVAARQALINMPDDQYESQAFAQAFFSLLSLRKVQPDIYLSIVTPGMAEPRLKEHKHVLQVGWDNEGVYDKPTVLLPQADFRANAFKNIIEYPDFDQVMSRLMIPERTEESAMQVCEWTAKLQRTKDGLMLYSPDGEHMADIFAVARSLVTCGAVLVAVIDDKGQAHPLYALNDIEEMNVQALIGIALNENALYGELQYAVRHQSLVAPCGDVSIADLGLQNPSLNTTLRLLVTGWVGSLPLLLNRLAHDYAHVELMILDNLTDEEVESEASYLDRRLNESRAMGKDIKVSVKKWDFFNMEVLREYVKSCTHILLSRPKHMDEYPYALISSVLSHIMTLVRVESVQPVVYPVLVSRNHARLLQQELERFSLPTEVHFIVPDEFYGTYVAHTGFHMYTSEDMDTYQMKRALRHVITALMSDIGASSVMGLQTLQVIQELPEDASQLYADLLAQGYIWIGYRFNEAFRWNDPLQSMVHKLFPREGDFHCMQQHKIIINPFGNPVSRRSWVDKRKEIVELIVIAENTTSQEATCFTTTTVGLI